MALRRKKDAQTHRVLALLGLVIVALVAVFVAVFSDQLRTMVNPGAGSTEGRELLAVRDSIGVLDTSALEPGGHLIEAQADGIVIQSNQISVQPKPVVEEESDEDDESGNEPVFPSFPEPGDTKPQTDITVFQVGEPRFFSSRMMYQFTVKNNGPADAYDVSVSNLPLPAYLVRFYMGMSSDGQHWCRPVPNDVPPYDMVEITCGNSLAIPAGSEITFAVQFDENCPSDNSSAASRPIRFVARAFDKSTQDSNGGNNLVTSDALQICKKRR